MYRNQTRSLSGIEWELPLRELGIGWLPDNIAVKAKVSTAFSKNRIDICDETKWIEPLGI